MKLTLEQIQSISCGALDIWADDDGNVHFKRFTEEQLDILGNIETVFKERALSTTGCRLDFYTDSGHLMFEPAHFCKYEVLVNGLQAMAMEGKHRVTLPLPEGENRVTILLSDHSTGVLKMVYLDQGASIRPYTYDRKFLFLGDSITQGWESSTPSLSYVNLVSSYFNAEVLNWGVGGTRFLPETLVPVCYDPDMIFISFGTNDFVHYQSLDTIKALCKQYMDKVQQLFPGKPVCCISPIWRADGQVIRPAGSHQDVRNVIIEQIDAHGFTHIDGYTLVPHMEKFFSDKFLHPNDLGFALYAQNMIKALSPLL